MSIDDRLSATGHRRRSGEHKVGDVKYLGLSTAGLAILNQRVASRSVGVDPLRRAYS